VIETVGGATLVGAWTALAPGGSLQSIGWTSGEPAVFPPYGTVGLAKSLQAFQAGGEFGTDLEYLLELVAAGRLAVDVGWRGSWQRFDEAVAGLLGREFAGKAVLDHD
jgi:NADPH:quinone reductase-like Zn-dependent oxidoreductase